MPEFLFENPFKQNVQKAMNQKGFVLFNTIITDKKDQLRNDDFIALFDTGKFAVKRLSRIEGNNELIIWNN